MATTPEISDSTELKTLNDSLRILRFSNPIRAIEIGSEMKDSWRNYPSCKEKANTFNILGNVYFDQGVLDRSLQHHLDGLIICSEIGDRKGAAYTMNDIGFIYLQKKITDLSIEYFTRSVNIFSEIQDNLGLALAYYNLGQSYVINKNFNQAEKYYFNSLHLYEKTDSLDLIVNSHRRLAEFYLDINRLDDAKNQLIEALKFVKAGTKNKAYLFLSLAKYEALIGKETAAINYADSAFDIFKSIPQWNHVCSALYLKARLLKKNGANEEAYRIFSEAEEIARKHNLNVNLLEILRNKAEMLHLLGHDAEAFAAQQIFIQFNDSINTMKTTFGLMDYYMQSETKEIRSQNIQLKDSLSIEKERVEAKNQQLKFIVILTVLLILFAGFIVRYLRKVSAFANQLREKNTEIELKSQQLEAANHTKNQLFSIIGHDLKGSAGNIVQLFQLLQEEHQENPIIAAGAQQSATIEKLLLNLLEWSRMQTGRLKVEHTSFDLSKSIHDILAFFAHDLKKKNIEFAMDIPLETKVFGDEELLKTVFRNIISNCLKYTPEGGSIQFIAKKNPQNGVEIHIIDSGVGMNKTQIDDLFIIKKFKSQRGTLGEMGTGLGMVISHEIVNMHDGEITVESETGSGSKFIIRLPK